MFARLGTHIPTKKELEDEVESLRSQLLLKRQQEEDQKLHAESMKWLEDNRAPSLPVHSHSQSAHTTPAKPTGFAPYAGSDINGFDGHFASDGVLAGRDRKPSAPQWGFSADNPLDTDESSIMDPGPEPSSGTASNSDHVASLASPSSFDTSFNSRKRAHNGLSSPTDHISKSIRPTPSPALTGPTTPSSLDFDFGNMEENDEMMRLLGGNPKEHLREMREEQKAQEKALRAKQEQEKKDEEFARKLMLEMQNFGDPEGSVPSSQSVPGNFPSNIFQTSLDSNGGFRRPTQRPHLPAPPLYSSSPPQYGSPVKKEDRISMFDSPTRIKPESSYNQTKPNRYADTSDFIDLSSDDNDDLAITGQKSSSDLVDVGSSTWQADSREGRPKRELPWMKGEHTTGRNNGLHGIMPYQSPTRKPSGWADMATGAWNVAQNTAQSVYDAGQAYFNPYSGVGSGSDPITLPEMDYYPGMSQDNITLNAFNAQGLNPYDPENKDLVNRYMERVDYLTHDPTRTTAEIKSLLENIRPDEDLPEEDREGTPEAMAYKLMPHQQLGLTWMRKMEEGSNKGGILADDMGLGKTIQALALMVSRRSTDPSRKTTLIVAPVALMRQWEKEIRTKLKTDRAHKLTTFILHGTKRSVTWEQLRTYDVVLTTFGTLANEIKRKEAMDMRKRANPNWRPTGASDRLPLLGDECKWYRVIIDEAQCIKNRNTKAALGAARLQALSRFCMSGTPMMNNVGELYSLIRFLRIKPYDSAEKFNHDFTNPIKKGDPTGKAMRMLQALLKAILLRRTKKSTIDGKPILSLPERTTHAQHSEFNSDERQLYTALETQTKVQFNKYLKAGTVNRNYSNVLVLLLRLRQACCHPHLIKDFGEAAGASTLSIEEMLKLAKELVPEVIARIRDSTGTEPPHGLECPVCMDMTANASIVVPCGHSTCSECFAKISDPSQAIANGDAEGNSNDAKCPTCRGKIVLTKVINHDAFKQAHMPEFSGNQPDNLTGIGLDDSDDSDDSTDDGDGSDTGDDVDADGNLKDFIDDDDVKEESITDDDESATEGYRRGKTPFDKATTKPKPKKDAKKSKKGKGKARADTKKAPKKTLAQLKKEGASNAKARRKYIARLRKEYIPSAKIEKTMEILQNVMEGGNREKTIIFSQFTSLLDLVEIPILETGWGFRRYDGSMTATARNEAVEEFTDKPNCRIMLVSLKAGNAGLNLVAASQVIILDPFWNPYIEEQAIDRAHRIGQLRPVEVHRILVPDTVEDRILQLQEKKRGVIEGALDEKAAQTVGRLGERELAFLFVSIRPLLPIRRPARS
ncbi:MAG: hypothetical protein Q9195_006826 [Heterodermia aff. obscurata]